MRKKICEPCNCPNDSLKRVSRPQSREVELRQSMVFLLSLGDRAECESRETKAVQVHRRRTREKRVARTENPNDPQRVPSWTHQNTDQCTHVRKMPKLREPAT